MLLMNTRSLLFFFICWNTHFESNIGLQEQVKNYIEGVCLYTWLKHRFWRNITNYKKIRAQKEEEKKGMGIRKSYYQFHHGGEMKEESEEKYS